MSLKVKVQGQGYQILTIVFGEHYNAKSHFSVFELCCLKLLSSVRGFVLPGAHCVISRLLLGRVALVAQRSIVVKLSRGRSVGL